MKRKPEHFDAAPRDALPKDLQATLDRVGPAHYARATARKFAAGGPYSPERRRKPRTALT